MVLCKPSAHFIGGSSTAQHSMPRPGLITDFERCIPWPRVKQACRFLPQARIIYNGVIDRVAKTFDGCGGILHNDGFMTCWLQRVVHYKASGVLDPGFRLLSRCARVLA